MSRRHRKGRPVHGILLLDKPSGGSSNRALQRAKRLYGASKAGHTGSLDPLATGMLPICFGEATKLSAFLLDADKGYETTMQLGVTTDSADSDGTVLEQRVVPPELTREAFEQLCRRFVGRQQQVPPMVSAIKIDGQRLYQLARQGKTVERTARDITIHHLEVIDFSGSSARLAVRCSKGTYIRSLVTDIGEALGCGAHVSALRRTHVSPFDSLPMIGFEQLEALAGSDGDQVSNDSTASSWSALDALLLPMDAGLDHLSTAVLDEQALARFRRGQAASVQTITSGKGGDEAVACSGVPPCRVKDQAGRLVGLGELDTQRELVAPRRVLQCD